MIAAKILGFVLNICELAMAVTSMVVDKVVLELTSEKEQGFVGTCYIIYPCYNC